MPRDFSLGAWSALAAAGQALSQAGKEISKKYDKGEDEYLKLMSSKNFRLKPGATYRKGMTAIQVHQLFESVTEDDTKYLTDDDKTILKNLYAGRDPFYGLDDDAIVSSKIADKIVQFRGQISREGIAAMSAQISLQKMGQDALEQLVKYGVTNEEALKKAMNDKFLSPLVDKLAKSAGLNTIQLAAPGIFNSFLRAMGRNPTQTGFAADNVNPDTGDVKPATAEEKRNIMNNIIKTSKTVDEAAKAIQADKRLTGGKTVNPDTLKSKIRVRANSLGKNLEEYLQPPAVRGTAMESQLAQDLQKPAPTPAQSLAETTPTTQPEGQQTIGGFFPKVKDKLAKMRALMAVSKARITQQR